MKFFRKTFAFLISAMIMASLVGCGASNESRYHQRYSVS